MKPTTSPFFKIEDLPVSRHRTTGSLETFVDTLRSLEVGQSIFITNSMGRYRDATVVCERAWGDRGFVCKAEPGGVRIGRVA